MYAGFPFGTGEPSLRQPLVRGHGAAGGRGSYRE
jgi:hypothetical protein